MSRKSLNGDAAAAAVAAVAAAASETKQDHQLTPSISLLNSKTVLTQVTAIPVGCLLESTHFISKQCSQYNTLLTMF